MNGYQVKSESQNNGHVPVQNNQSHRNSRVSPMLPMPAVQARKGSTANQTWSLPKKSVSWGGHHQHVYKTHRQGTLSITKIQTKLFLSGLGVVLLAGGTALTIYGANEELTDFIVLGSALIVVSFTLLLTAILLAIRDCCKVKALSELLPDEEQPAQERRESRKYIGPEYNLPPPNMSMGVYSKSTVPAGDELYGKTSSPSRVSSAGRPSSSILTAAELNLRTATPPTPPIVVMPSEQSSNPVSEL